MAPGGPRNFTLSKLWVGLGLSLVVLVAMRAPEWLPSEGPPVVTDDAGLLDDAEGRYLAEYHRRLLEDHDIDYRVITIADAGDLNRFAYDAFRQQAVGSLSETGRGLLLVLDPAADRVRLEVGAALEAVYTDAFTTYLEHRQMVPFFRTGRIAEGIVATTELIVARAQEARQGRGFDPMLAAGFSLGGGATTAARIGVGPDDALAIGRPDVDPAETPERAIDAYLEAMGTRNARPDLALYSRTTRAMLEDWTITAAQMDTIARAYAGCGQREVRFDPSGEHAVVRYAIGERKCAPWFFVRENSAWRIDLAASQDAIRFNHRNQWRLAERDASGYGFGFADWRFDDNGFPIDAP
jgi:uncharacterized protein